MGGRGSSSHFVRARIVAHNAVRRAKKMAGSSAYSRFRSKRPLIAGVNQCNLFAADAFNKSTPSVKPLLETPIRHLPIKLLKMIGDFVETAESCSPM